MESVYSISAVAYTSGALDESKINGLSAQTEAEQNRRFIYFSVSTIKKEHMHITTQKLPKKLKYTYRKAQN